MDSQLFYTLSAGGVVVLGLLLHYLYGERRTVLKNGDVLVRPARWPFVGVAWGLSTDSFLQRMDAIIAQYGPLTQIYIGTNKVTLVACPVMCKEVLLARPKAFRRQRLFDHAAQRLGAARNLFFANNTLWSTARKFAAPSFNRHNVHAHTHAITRLAVRWAQRMKREGLADARTPIDFKAHTLTYTLSVITKTAFGVDDSDEESFFNSPQFPRDLQAFFEYIVNTIIFPWPLWAFRWFPAQRALEDAAKDADTRIAPACMAVIRARREELQRRQQQSEKEGLPLSTTAAAAGAVSGGVHSHAQHNSLLLDTLLRKQDGEFFRDQDVLENVKAFYLAGSETTSISISWAAFFLAQRENRGALERVREEAKLFFARCDHLINNDDHSVDDKNESNGEGKKEMHVIVQETLPFTEAVLKETLRLRSPASLLNHELEDGVDSFTLSNGLTLRRDDGVIFAYFDAIMHSDKYFENAKSFLPDRWLDSDAEKRERCEAHLLSFGFGPRVCPGQRLAMLEGTLAIAALVHEFDIALGCDPSEICRVALFTSVPDKMPIILTPVR